MLSGHHYWNLEAYQETQDLTGHWAQFDSSKIVATDGLLIPNGSYVDVKGTALDFQKGKSIGNSINDTIGHEYCGTGEFHLTPRMNFHLPIIIMILQVVLASIIAGSTTITLGRSQFSHFGALIQASSTY